MPPTCPGAALTVKPQGLMRQRRFQNGVPAVSFANGRLQDARFSNIL